MTYSMFATVISNTNTVGALLMSSVEVNSSRISPIDVDGSVYFTVQSEFVNVVYCKREMISFSPVLTTLSCLPGTK